MFLAVLVASLIHDDVLDDADTRRGIGLLNFLMDDMLAVLARDFLLSRVCVALASLKNRGPTTDVAMLAFEYGKNLGILIAPILFAMEEFPQLCAIVDEGFENLVNVDIKLQLVLVWYNFILRFYKIIDGPFDDVV
ncbi:hypothetical protein JHK85_004634 [Glycine max]|nr:hypothetical protein JHK85_004634 [Glycine max]KAG5080393.1 hypothetical protein JHK86_004458 [Glycine max]